MKLNSANTPIEIYHGVPDGWSKSELESSYRLMNGSSSFDVDIATEPGCPDYLPDRDNWLQYRAAMIKICELIKTGDKVAIELGIQYIELNYFGSYSGFLRERIARLIRNQELSEEQVSRLIKHINKLNNAKHCMQEFREYSRLKVRLIAKGNT